MADDKTKTGVQDRLRVSLSEEYEVKDWCNKFNVSRKQLEEAVSEVGNMADDVEQYLISDRKSRSRD